MADGAGEKAFSRELMLFAEPIAVLRLYLIGTAHRALLALDGQTAFGPDLFTPWLKR